MMHEALELTIPSRGQFTTWEDLVVTLVAADSTEDLLSLLKERPSELGWRLALLCPDALTEFLEKKDEGWEVKSEWKLKIVYVGEKNKSHGVKEYVLRRQYVQEDVENGLVPLCNGVPPSKGKGGYSTEAYLKRGGKPFFEAGGKKGRGYVCLVVVKKEIFEAIKKKKNGELRKDSRLLELREIYVGDSPQAEQVRKDILRAADINDPKRPILIVGETGTGKEIVAQEIHRLSKRTDPLLTISCGERHPNFTAQIFGHEKGAFTGALGQQKGPWERAGKGTFFMDEIGELSENDQTALLRALEKRKIQRLGMSGIDIEVHAQVIAATKQDLFAMVSKGSFRDDLYYRLNGYLIETPAIRHHPQSIPHLANHLWKQIANDENVPPLPREILDELMLFPWPGNVRDLRCALNYLHDRQMERGVKSLSLTSSDLRAVSYKIPGMVRSRKLVMAPEGQAIQIRTIAEKISRLKVVTFSRIEASEPGKGLDERLREDLGEALKALGLLLDGNVLKSAESVIALTDLKGRIELVLKDQLELGAKAAVTLRAMIMPKLIEGEQALQKECALIEQDALALENTDRVCLSQDLLLLSEGLARHTHEVWRRQREAEGWKKGETWDGVQKTNPDLVAYSELPEKEKDLSRKAGLGTLKAIVALGYSIERPDDGYDQ